MTKQAFFLFLTLALLLPSACKNPGEERRRSLRDATTALAPNAARRIGEINRNARLLSGGEGEADSTMLRWQAAQNLGTLKATGHIDLLLRKGISTTADPSENVRRECVLALGHMPVKTPLNVTRRRLVAELRDRLLETRQSFSQAFLSEDNGQVRLAIISTLITLGMPGTSRDAALPKVGFQDVASALFSIARRFVADDAPGDQRINNAIVERSLGGLEVLAGVDKKTWAKARRDLDSEAYIAWWDDRISEMPSLEELDRAAKKQP